MKPCFAQAMSYDFVRRVGKKYYVSYKVQRDFDEAVRFCANRGLALALPKSDVENAILTEFLDEGFNTAWINVENRKQEGKFEVDMKGQPLTFTKWGNGEPKVPEGEKGCTLLKESGTWQVTNKCFTLSCTICEI